MNVLVSAGEASEKAGIPWETIGAITPHVIWLLFIVFFLRWIGRDRILHFLDRLQKVKIGEVEVELRQALREAAEKRQEAVPTIAIGRAARRLIKCAYLISRARILWIDDNPDNNASEIALFEDVGGEVDTTISTEEAKVMLSRARYDLILSDIGRGEEATAGIDFAKELARNPKSPPVIIYTVKAEKTLPEGTFGITDRPDELVHLVLDLLARKRG